MQTGAAKPAVDVRALILDALRQRPYRPAELLEQLQTREISEARLKDELAALIEDQMVELSPDRYIKLRDRTPTAAS